MVFADTVWLSSQIHTGSKYIQEQFLEFLADKLELWKQYPRITSGSVDTLVDCLLLISNRNPSPLAAKAMLVVTSMFTKGTCLVPSPH